MLNSAKRLSTPTLRHKVYKRLTRSRLGPCALCGAQTDPHPQLCYSCLADLPWVTEACARCARPLGAGTQCGSCLQSPPPYQRTIVAFEYRYPIEGLVHKMKYQAKTEFADLLGTLMSFKVADSVTDYPQCLIPVPLHSRRLIGRGFNQSLELARPLARACGINLDPFCTRRRVNTKPQAQLPASVRHANVRAAFAVTRRLRYKHVAIVDDVITTAWTACELTRVLLKEGVERVDLWICCRAYPQR